MNKYLLKTVCFLLTGLVTFAQSKEEKKYNENATEVQEEIWNSGDKAFDVTEIPGKYKNESAVIIARSVNISNSTRRKFVITRTVKQYKFFTTLRERILIMDKSALEEYSTLNYKKLADNTVQFSFYKLVNSSTTYIGIKIVKPSGKIIKINPTEEEVLTKNKNREKEGKIAIPDLQVGDILEYYIHIEEVSEDYIKTMGPHVYYLQDDYPVLNYHVKYILDKKSGADIINVNGAAPIEESTNEDKDMVIEFTEKDLPKLATSPWMSKSRQVPYYAIRYGFAGSAVYAKPGQLNKGPYQDILKDKLTTLFSELITYKSFYPKTTFDQHFGGRKNILTLPVDSVLNYLYSHYKWYLYGRNTYVYGWNPYGNKYDIDVSNKRNHNNMDWWYSATSFCEILRGYDIKGDVVVVCNRNSGNLADAFLTGDFETFVRIKNNGSERFFCFNNYFEDAGKLSAEYEGQDALIFTREMKGMKTPFKNTEAAVTLPVSKSNQNVVAEKLNVTFNKGDLRLINIVRTVNETGYMKHNSQKSLLLAEEFENALAKIQNQKTAVEKLMENKKLVGQAGEITTAFAKEKPKQKDYFNEEIKQQYDQEPKELLHYKINNTGLSIAEPAFEYTATFTMDGFLKKAGNNFIFDVGRLMGSYKKTDGKDTIRTADVYMPSARQLNYEFTVALPDGYIIKGMEALNQKVDNDIASFVSTARLDGNVATITVNRTYYNNFEPAANWPKLLRIMNAAADFTNLKLLLEKKN